MFQRVVVPVNFTSTCDWALAAAAPLAARAGAHVELVTVAFPASRRDVEARLATLADHVGVGTTWRMIPSAGPVATALLAELRGAADDELWCVGSHAHGAVAEFLVGSVSAQLARGCQAPIVLAGPHLASRPAAGVVAVALDGSADDAAIVADARRLAGDLGMSLRLVQLEGGEGTAQPVDVGEASDVIPDGHPARRLASYVEGRPEVALIAVATRRRTGRRHVLSPSTALELAHRSPVPVVLLAPATRPVTGRLAGIAGCPPSPRAGR